MKNQRSTSHLIFSVLILILGFGLIAGCSKESSESETDENTEAMTSEEQPMEQQQGMEEAQTFQASLSGSSEVPSVTSDASGMVTVTLQGDEIQIKGSFSGLSSKYVASHIHKGAEGENGSPIQPLEPSIGSDSLSGSWDASYQLSESDIAALKADSLYINVHSMNHKSGEIRGQLSSGM